MLEASYCNTNLPFPFYLDLRDLGIAELLELLLQEGEFVVAHILDINKHITRRPDSADELVELEVDGARVAVLGVLDEEDHEEGENGGRRIDNELPGRGEPEQGAAQCPDDDKGEGDAESPRRAQFLA